MIVGIDPGALGGIAFLRPDGTLHDAIDMPAFKVAVGKTQRTRVSEQALAMVLAANMPTHAYVENSGPMPTDGSQQAFGMGLSAGIVRGVVAALAIPMTLVTAASWKKAMQVSSDKGECRQRAMRLFPSRAALFVRAKDHGRAEAALIAYHCHAQAYARLAA